MTTESRPEHVRRHAERAATDRASLHRILDAQCVGTLATTWDGEPWLVPMLYARVGERIVVHGSTGAGALGAIARGAPAAFSVMALDAIVVAPTLFASSANYRSAVVHGTAEVLRGEQAREAIDAISDAILPGRSGEVRTHTRKELAGTTVLALSIDRFTVKVRQGPPSEPDPEDRGAWAGTVPLRTAAANPVPAPWVNDGTPVPASVRALAGRAHPIDSADEVSLP
ncbi:pyridoxamine 5'-phosphate oxidase family protein [Rhodococcus rhodnii]|nr:pyridoxamine 5'-phosphate oxidase family protein [Rhodococcus rhodnii]TXG92790.1 pyridoxamine 5'-phosphate oxidase family protein [Rhodococcus rhodnii]